MCVHFEHLAHLRMAEPLGDDLHGDPGGEEERPGASSRGGEKIYPKITAVRFIETPLADFMGSSRSTAQRCHAPAYRCSVQ